MYPSTLDIYTIWIRLLDFRDYSYDVKCYRTIPIHVSIYCASQDARKVYFHFHY